MSTRDDTIVAISSPHGRSLRGLIRLAGPLTASILQALTQNNPPTAREIVKRHLFLPCEAAQKNIAGNSKHIAKQTAGQSVSPLLKLPVLVLYFASPASYTGQAMAEIQCPGHPALLQRIIHQAIALGARMAEAGEFTFRAYLAGKLDLTQAEGVAATITAQSDAQLHAATLLRKGKLGSLSQQLVEDLAESLAAVEAGIDFTDQEDVKPIAGDILIQRLNKLLKQVQDTLTASRHWGDLEALPSVVLVGPPSVGKSTLFNALLGRQRSVISAQPGTTRDILAEPLSLEYQGRAMQVMLMDIAGLDTPASALDHQVQAAARQAITKADVILALGDHQSRPPTLASLGSELRATSLCVRTKADLPQQREAQQERALDVLPELPVVALTGQGLEALKDAIAKHVGSTGVSFTGQMLALQPRHERSFVIAADEIISAISLLETQTDKTGVDYPELVASSLRMALDELAALGGQMTPDDVIGMVFAKFCVGK